MTQQEFNTKYKNNIPVGYYGLGFNTPEVTQLLDSYFSTKNNFEIFQIKMKFNFCRIYTSGLPELEIHELETQVNELYNSLIR
jgi:hypothetical protein